MIISDVAKDCIDCLKRVKDEPDRLAEERARISTLALPAATSCASKTPVFPPIFKYAAAAGGLHHCLYCNSVTRIDAANIQELTIHPASFIAVCTECQSIME